MIMKMGEVYKMKGLKQFLEFDLDAFTKDISSKAYYNYIDGQVSDQVAGIDVLLLKTTLEIYCVMRLPMNTKKITIKVRELIKLTKTRD